MPPNALRILPPSPDLLRATRAELGERLPPEQRRVLAILGVSDFLTCMTVVHGERAAGRMILPLAKLEEVTAPLGGLGLVVQRGQREFLPTQNLVEGTDHQRTVVPRGTPGATHGVLYFGLEKDFVEGAEAAELAGQDELLARLFGYPECCIQAFLQQSRRAPDRTAAGIPGTGPFPRALNPCLPHLTGLYLLFHFPCSPRCEPSQALLRQRLKYLGRLAPSVLGIEQLGAGLALYGPPVGIALATRYRDAGDGWYEVEEVVTASERSRAVLATADGLPRIRARSVHQFEINGVSFDDERCLIARFE